MKNGIVKAKLLVCVSALAVTKSHAQSTTMGKYLRIVQKLNCGFSVVVKRNGRSRESCIHGAQVNSSVRSEKVAQPQGPTTSPRCVVEVEVEVAIWQRQSIGF